VQEIGDWLEKLGMSEYGECFAENKVDLSVLPHLTDQDLKDIGVPLGIGGRCGGDCPARRHLHCRSACSCAWVPEAAAAHGFDLPTDTGSRRRAPSCHGVGDSSV
jgi:hypothetical protein